MSTTALVCSMFQDGKCQVAQVPLVLSIKNFNTVRIFHKHVVPGPRNRYYRGLHVVLSEDDKRSGNLSVCITKLDVFKIRRYSK